MKRLSAFGLRPSAKPNSASQDSTRVWSRKFARDQERGCNYYRKQGIVAVRGSAWRRGWFCGLWWYAWRHTLIRIWLWLACGR